MAAHAASTRMRSTPRMVALAVAAVFALVGVLGFVPGITTDYSQLGFAGHASEAALLGLFQVSSLHTIVHLLLGVVGFAMAPLNSADNWLHLGLAVGMLTGPTTGGSPAP